MKLSSYITKPGTYLKTQFQNTCKQTVQTGMLMLIKFKCHPAKCNKKSLHFRKYVQTMTENGFSFVLELINF